jgi:hypothetical protein
MRALIAIFCLNHRDNSAAKPQPQKYTISRIHDTYTDPESVKSGKNSSQLENNFEQQRQSDEGLSRRRSNPLRFLN